MKKDYFNPTGTNEREPLDKEILFNDCKNTLYPEKYCDGVWALKTNDNNTYSSLKFHVERGGDPDVWIDWIKKHKEVLTNEMDNYNIYS